MLGTLFAAGIAAAAGATVTPLILLGGAAVCLVSYRLMLRIGRLPQDVRVLQ